MAYVVYWIFIAGTLAGIGITLLAGAAHEQVKIVRYLRRRRAVSPPAR